MKKMNLFQKFTITIIALGLVPMLVLSTFIANTMISDYRGALRLQYEQAADYVASSLEGMLDSYNTISKICFSYRRYTDADFWNDYYSFDKLRQIVQGDGCDPETLDSVRESNMREFLSYVDSVDARIDGVHFLGVDGEGEKLDFHYSSMSTYFKDETLFEELVDYENWDRTNNKLILIPTHETGYFSGMGEPVFTVARNYFDLRGSVGNTPYVGTIFLDISMKRMDELFRRVKFSGKEVFYVLDANENCLYNSAKEEPVPELSGLSDTEQQLVIETKANEYGLRVYVLVNTSVAFGKIRSIQRIMYLLLAASIISLCLGSVFFSKKLTEPIHAMMDQMAQVESGNFDIQLPVNSSDEIGVLSERFNQMSRALKNYINQSYVAQIKQTEAELTALKSQIYPHFLYNTLEVIRMTALEEGGEKVAKMIEALSEQIHYLIGPMQDMVTLEQEITIVQKYVYLLNCRIQGKVHLVANARGAKEIHVPKLILQPIVENAYVHGIKPKKGSGNIMIDVDSHDGILEISVMDNGLGMDEKALQKIQALLDGNEPGIKNEVNWQSIGLKNVHDRIRFLYGEEYGISVSSTLAVGTIVRILMPAEDTKLNP